MKKGKKKIDFTLKLHFTYHIQIFTRKWEVENGKQPVHDFSAYKRKRLKLWLVRKGQILFLRFFSFNINRHFETSTPIFVNCYLLFVQ